MVAFKAVLALALVGIVQSQDDVYTAYSPGQYAAAPGGVYKATPRLVPVKVRVPPSNISPFSHPSFDQRSSPSFHQRHFESLRHQQRPVLMTATAASRQQHFRIRPTRPSYFHESGQPLQAGTLKRVRVAAPSASPYALDQPIQFTHTVPAVATYRGQGSPYQQQALAQHQQPAYYVPRAHQAQPQPQHQPEYQPQQYQQQGQRPLLRKVPVKAAPEEEPEEEYPGDPNPQYNFAFDVKDDDLTNYQNRQETRDKGVTKGSYSVVDPDGYVRTVTYEATAKGGFVAKVTREPTDVKIKFPVPTQAPEEELKGQGGLRQQQQAYAPQQYQPANAYAQPGPSYSPQPQQQQSQPSYVPRRFPQPQGQGHRLAPRYPQ